MVGYCEASKAYRIWNSKTRKIIISRDVIFDEEISQASSIQISQDKTENQQEENKNEINIIS